MVDSYEDIRRADMQRQNERRQIFLDLISKEFSSADIFIPPDEPWRIRVEIDSPQTVAIVFQPNDPLLMDVGNSFERIFKDAIQRGRQILDNRPQKSVFQGKLHLNNKGVIFEPYKKQE